jgi:hypothetical protein
VREVASLRIYRCLVSKDYVFDTNWETFKNVNTVKRRLENNIIVQCENTVAVIIKIRATEIPGE